MNFFNILLEHNDQQVGVVLPQTVRMIRKTLQFQNTNLFLASQQLNIRKNKDWVNFCPP